MTIGEYLKQIIAQRGISVTQLSSELGLKSRNVLYRLFGNYYSVQKTSELIEQIDKKIVFSNAEKAKIGEFLNKGMISRKAAESRDILSSIYRGAAGGGFGVSINGKRLLFSDALNRAAETESVVFMSGISDSRLIGDIDSFLGNSEKTEVFNYLQFSQQLMTCHEINALLVLKPHKNYTPLLAQHVGFKGVFVLCKSGAEHYAFKLEHFRDDYIYLEAPISEEIYDHIIYKKDKFNETCTPIKEHGSRVSDYIDIMNDSALFDSGVTYYSEGAPCFGNLPYDIVYDMFKDINYFGFPKDHPYVQKLINAFVERQKGFMKNNAAKKRYLFDHESIKYMMQTGLSFDHAERFNPMTPAQLRKFFDILIQYAREMPEKISFRFTKEPLRYPFVYGIDIMLYSYVSGTGYMDGFVINLKNKAIFDVMNDFMPYVWDNFTISEADSIKILEDMSEKYIK